MSTLSLLKTRIADDLVRSDLTTQIGEAIEDAIEHYRTTRFWFNETRDATFATVAAQAVYDVDDDADIPLFFDIDQVFLVDGTQNYKLSKSDPQELEYLSDSGGSSSRPYRWAWFDRSFRLYPIPDAAYTIRPVGAIEKASPATDAETGNVWMTEAFELLRCHAKGLLAIHVIKHPLLATAMLGAELDGLGGATWAARKRMRGATNKRTTSGRITPTAF